MKTIISKFLYLFNRREKLQMLAIVLLMLVGALLETFVVGLIYPFISILKRPEIIQEHKVLRWIYEAMSIRSTKEFLIWSSVGLILVYLFKNSYLLFLTYVQSRFTFNKLIIFSRRLFTCYLHQPYTFHLQRNTAELIYKINTAVFALFSGFLFYILMFVIEIMTTIFIVCLLILMKPLLSMVTGGILSIITIVFYRGIRRKISELGRVRQLHGEQMVQWVSQGLGGIKETKILGREGFFISAYEKNSKGYARSEQFFNIINQLPRLFLETLCVVSMLVIMLLTIAWNGEFQSIIPTMSLFAVAAFRIIPSMNRIFAAATQMRYHSYSLDVVYNDLTLLNKQVPLSRQQFSNAVNNEAGAKTRQTTNALKYIMADFTKYCNIFYTKICAWVFTICSKRADNQETTCIPYSKKLIGFDEAIELRDVYYQYPNTKKPVLNSISLKIPKHNSIGFVGPSGAGKTTIVDVIVGLLIPIQGEVLIDGKSIKDDLPNWQRMIGYIPQNIYLSDDTVRRNIAFGLPDEQIDEEQVWSVLASAHLEKFVNSLPDKLGTFVGERGIRLSGGQRQRIGIARALYHNPEVLVMDEGTASLDNETEWGVMQAVKRLSGNKTVIIIAHRLSTVKNCDRLYFIREGEVVNYGIYDELIANCAEFRAMALADKFE